MSYLKFLDKLPKPIDEMQLNDGSFASAHLTIPQLDGTQMPIAMQNMSTLSEMLGMYYTPIGNGTKHVE